MKNKIDLEIVFPSEEEVSIFLNGESDKEGDLLLFSRYALQQIANFGGDDTSSSIASYLIEVSKNIDNFLSNQDPDSPRLVENKQGKRKFIVRSVVNGDTFDFNLMPSGFGFFGKGLGYYGPNSIIALLRFLANKGNNDFKKSLSKVAKLTGEAYFDGKVTFESRATLPMEIVKKSTK